jgi:tetratricopeptide (TPR) repeat protein
VILKEKALEGLRNKLLGQSQAFYEKLRRSLEGEHDRVSRAALAEALYDAAVLYKLVGAGQKAEEAHRAALALRAALVAQQPGDPALRRGLGLSHLSLARFLQHTGSRFDEARAEIARARDVLTPVIRDHPGDGGARMLAAECDSQEAELFEMAGRPAEASAVLARARALYEALIRDNPPSTLSISASADVAKPSAAADALTEYRRGLAQVLGRTATSYLYEGLAEETLRIETGREPMLEELAHGAFADDQDRQRLAVHYYRGAMALRHLGRTSEAIRSYELAVAIFRRLAESSPSVTSYKAAVAAILNYISGTYRERGDYANGVRYTSEAMEIFRALRSDQAGGAEFASHVAECETTLALSDLGMSRLDEATRRMRQCVFDLERADRAHPDPLGGVIPTSPNQGLGDTLIQLAVVELSAGEAREARRAADRVREVVGPILRSGPDLRHVRHWKVLGLLVESLLDLQEGRVREASRAADEAAGELEGLKPPLLHQEHFDLGLAHALLYAAGRPAGPGRPAEPPGLSEHAERAIAELTAADGMGFRYPTITARVDEILGHRPGIHALLVDQLFPVDPFRTANTDGEAP